MQDTLEVRLPLSEQTVVIRTYLTTGESRLLQKTLFAQGNFDINKGTFDQIDPSTVLEMQDKAAEFLIQSIRDKEGKEQSFTADWLYKLRAEDGNVVYEKVNDIIQSSNLTDESKKK